jgi:trans-aconitate methyltransferase
MENNWKRIWEKKQMEPGEGSVLSQLVAVDGFNTFGGITERDWLAHTEAMGAKMGVRPGSSMYEVGCGAGAFLYPFYTRGHRVGGCDFAENLVGMAQNVMPLGNFATGEAVALDMGESYDVVFSHGVFLYFPDLAYAARTLLQMLAKSRQFVAVFDVPDLARKEDALRLRRGHLGEEDYEKRYRGLDHLYFPREWFEEVLTGMDVEMAIEAQCLPGYMHNSCRYNVFLKKKAVSGSEVHLPQQTLS